MTEIEKKDIPEDKNLLDDLKLVVFHLRHSCDNIRNIAYAVDKIHRLTELPKERIEQLILKIGKNL